MTKSRMTYRPDGQGKLVQDQRKSPPAAGSGQRAAGAEAPDKGQAPAQRQRQKKDQALWQGQVLSQEQPKDQPQAKEQMKAREPLQAIAQLQPKGRLQAEEQKKAKEQLQAVELQPKGQMKAKDFPLRHGGARQTGMRKQASLPPDWSPTPAESLSSMEFTAEYKAWESPFQDDIDRLESLIRKEDGRPAGRQLPADAAPALEKRRAGNTFGAEGLLEAPSLTPDEVQALSTDERLDGRAARPGERRSTPLPDPGILSEWPQWPDAEPVSAAGTELFEGPVIDLDEIRASRKLKSVPARRIESGSAGGSRRGPSWPAVLLSVAGAIATGALFGYIALALFAGGSVLPAKDGGAAGNTASEPASAPAASPPASGAGSPAVKTESSAGGAPTSAGAAADVQADWPQTAFSLLQYGVFSAKDSAAAAASELKAGGLGSASAKADGGYRVYAGISSKRSGAESLAASISGTEVYIKEVSLPAAGKFRFAGSERDAKAFGPATSGLIAQLADMTLASASQAKPGAADKKAMAEWDKQLASWRQAYAAFRPGVQGKESAAAADSLESAVNLAAKELDAYNAAPSKARLWTVQSRSMDVFFGQRALIETLQP
ncbi:hypothetical protein VE23_09240 [Paenibacillus sp. D9]|uniref:hypothetical protein n=1 Tax=Paenibacillus sp. D9 TaxID=665792 RepID=UPI00061E7C98|nr:hypothetical protein [Paenibacillus sp. D9]KKC47292.1 hypothetical protein VE23_09240 [Paenibacillus sp. D9]